MINNARKGMVTSAAFWRGIFTFSRSEAPQGLAVTVRVRSPEYEYECEVTGEPRPLEAVPGQ